MLEAVAYFPGLLRFLPDKSLSRGSPLQPYSPTEDVASAPGFSYLCLVVQAIWCFQCLVIVLLHLQI